MKNSLKIIGVSLLIVIAGIKFINKSLERGLQDDFKSQSIVQESSLVDLKSALKKTEPIKKDRLDFYSNELISFYYPKKWNLTQNKLPYGYSIKLISNQFCKDLNILSLIIFDGTIPKEDALNSVLKGFLKQFKSYKIHNSTKTLFKDNLSVYKKIDITQPQIELFAEAYAFTENGNTYTLIKISDSENGLIINFADFENSFEILTYKNEGKKILIENVDAKETLAQNGDKLSQAFLGYAYLTGDGVSINYKRAFYWNKKLAESGYAGAMYLLGFQFKGGLGIKKDLVKGEYWIKEAKKNGFEK